jgi:hypothetical protein
VWVFTERCPPKFISLLQVSYLTLFHTSFPRLIENLKSLKKKVCLMSVSEQLLMNGVVDSLHEPHNHPGERPKRSIEEAERAYKEALLSFGATGLNLKETRYPYPSWKGLYRGDEESRGSRKNTCSRGFVATR